MLGYEPPSLSQKALARKASLELGLISKLEKDGFFHPRSTDKGPRYSSNDLAIARLLKQLMKLGFDLNKLKFVPETLREMTETWIESFGDLRRSILKSDTALAAGKKIVSINKELSSLLLQELLLQAIIKMQMSSKGRP